MSLTLVNVRTDRYFSSGLTLVTIHPERKISRERGRTEGQKIHEAMCSFWEQVRT